MLAWEHRSRDSVGMYAKVAMGMICKWTKRYRDTIRSGIRVDWNIARDGKLVHDSLTALACQDKPSRCMISTLLPSIVVRVHVYNRGGEGEVRGQCAFRPDRKYASTVNLVNAGRPLGLASSSCCCSSYIYATTRESSPSVFFISMEFFNFDVGKKVNLLVTDKIAWSLVYYHHSSTDRIITFVFYRYRCLNF